MKTLVAALASFVIGATSSVAVAEEPGGEGHPGLHLLLKAANLTPAQRLQAHQLLKAGWVQQRALHEQLETLHAQLADKLASPGPITAADLAPLQQQLAQLRGQREQQHTQTLLQIRALLTADQLRQVAQTHEQLKSLRAQMKALLPAPEDLEPLDGPMRMLDR